MGGLPGNSKAGSNKHGEREWRDSGMAFVLIFLVLFLVTKDVRSVYVAVLSHVVNMVWPKAFMPFAKVWLGLSHLLGTIMSKVILSVIFFFVVFPVSLFRRAMKKDTLQLKSFGKSKKSVFSERMHSYVRDDLMKPY